MAEIRMLTGGSAPTPSTNEVSLYVKPDKRFYMKDDTGSEVKLLTNESVINDLSVTLPLVKTGTTTPIISINTATTNLNGAMSALDKTKLDNATFLNTNSTLVLRNGQGDFNANQINANLFSGPSTTTLTIPPLTGAIFSDGTNNITNYSPLSINNTHVAVNAGIELTKLSQNPLNRALHTGTQLASTIFDFESASSQANATVLNTSSSTGLLPTNRYIFVDSTSTDVTISLPPATITASFTIKKVLGNNNVVITSGGTDTIEGSASVILTTQYEYISLVSNQDNMWMIVSSN